MIINRRKFLVGMGSVMAAAAVSGPAFALTTPAKQFGTYADGVTDDTAALTRALCSGQIIDGQGLTYAVSGNIVVPKNFAGFTNATLIQKHPEIPSCRTLFIQASQNFSIDAVKVIRGGDGSEHSQLSDMRNCAGIYIYKCSNFHLRRLEVTGGGLGTGLFLDTCDNFDLSSINIHDIQYLLPSHPIDDAIQGLYFFSCSYFNVDTVLVRDLGGSDGVTHTTDQNRGIAFSWNNNFKVTNCHVVRVGQGMDISGGDPGNSNFTFSNNLIEDCYSAGFKCANSCHDGVVTMTTVARSGIANFFICGASVDGMKYPCQNIRFDNCISKDVLGQYVSHHVPAGSPIPSAGFMIIPAAYQPTYPRAIVFNGCQAINTLPGAIMMYGFFNDILKQYTEGRPNLALNCSAQGYKMKDYTGFS